MVAKIQIQHLRKVYDTPERQVHALEDINLKAPVSPPRAVALHGTGERRHRIQPRPTQWGSAEGRFRFHPR